MAGRISLTQLTFFVVFNDVTFELWDNSSFVLSHTKLLTIWINLTTILLSIVVVDRRLRQEGTLFISLSNSFRGTPWTSFQAVKFQFSGGEEVRRRRRSPEQLILEQTKLINVHNEVAGQTILSYRLIFGSYNSIRQIIWLSRRERQGRLLKIKMCDYLILYYYNYWDSKLVQLHFLHMAGIGFQVRITR